LFNSKLNGRKLEFNPSLRQIIAVNVVYKIATSVAQLANCILLHAYSYTVVAVSCASRNKIFIELILAS